MVVKKGPAGRNWLTTFERRADQYIETCPISIPENFELELDLLVSHPGLVVGFGDLQVRFGQSGVPTILYVNDTAIRLGTKVVGAWFSFRLQRTGGAYVFHIDGQEVHVARFPGLAFSTVRFAKSTDFTVGKITVKPL
jgi:hypothetical protein